jgi:hypothetical protein
LDRAATPKAPTGRPATACWSKTAKKTGANKDSDYLNIETGLADFFLDSPVVSGDNRQNRRNRAKLRVTYAQRGDQNASMVDG